MIDKLHENLFFFIQYGYVIPDRQNGDFFSYEVDLKPLLQGTKFSLRKVTTDWPMECVFRYFDIRVKASMGKILLTH